MSNDGRKNFQAGFPSISLMTLALFRTQFPLNSTEEPTEATQ